MKIYIDKKTKQREYKICSGVILTDNRHIEMGIELNGANFKYFGLVYYGGKYHMYSFCNRILSNKIFLKEFEKANLIMNKCNKILKQNDNKTSN